MLEEETTPVAECTSNEPFAATQLIDFLNVALAPLLEAALLHSKQNSPEQESISSHSDLFGGPHVVLKTFECSSF